jgi:hypothetical protein
MRMILGIAVAVASVFVCSATANQLGYNQAATGKPTLTPTNVRREIRQHRDPVPNGTRAICYKPLYAFRKPCDGHVIEMMGEYRDNMECTRAIVAPNGETLTLSFTMFDLEIGDTLEIFDGCSAEELAIIDGATGTVLPTSVSSSEECLFLRFKTDGMWRRQGFNLTVTCNPPIPQESHRVCNRYLGNGGRQESKCRDLEVDGVRCIMLPDIIFGQVVYENDRWWPNTARYVCDSGYHPDPPEYAERVCMPNRVYAGDTPNCVGNICEMSSIPRGGLVRYWPPDRRYPATVTHSCAAGFMVDTSNGAEAVRECHSALQQFVGPVPNCTAVPCPDDSGPPGICACHTGYQGTPEWEPFNTEWLHNCTDDSSFDGSFGELGAICVEETDDNGHTCAQYVANGPFHRGHLVTHVSCKRTQTSSLICCRDRISMPGHGNIFQLRLPLHLLRRCIVAAHVEAVHSTVMVAVFCTLRLPCEQCILPSLQFTATATASGFPPRVQHPQPRLLSHRR